MLLIQGVANESNDVEVTCYNDDFVIFNDSTYNFRDLLCKETPKSDLMVTNKPCRDSNTVVAYVGFQTAHIFLTQYGICFETNKMNSLYTWYEARVPYINNQHNYYSDKFIYQKPSELYNGLNVHNAYSFDAQVSTEIGLQL